MISLVLLEDKNTIDNIKKYITKDILFYVISLYNFYMNTYIALSWIKGARLTNVASEKANIISLLTSLDFNDEQSWLKSIDIMINSMNKLWIDTSLITILKEDFESIYKFVDSWEIKHFIFDNKKEFWNILSWKGLDESIIKWISRKVILLLNMYIKNNNIWQKFEEWFIKLRKEKSEVDIQIKELKIELKQLKKIQSQSQKTISAKTSTTDRLNNETELLKQQISALESDIKNLKEQKNKEENQQTEKIDNWELDSALELASESEQKSQEYKKQLESVTTERDLLKTQLELLKSQLNTSTQFDMFIFKCEQFPDDCNTSDMLKYIIIRDTSLPYKKDIVDIIINFLEEFLLNVSKWASSGTNWKEWKGWWDYANNYINPLINYIKEKWRTINTQNFLEFVLNIDLKNLTNEIVETNYTNKKSRVFSNVYEQLEENNSMDIFKTLHYLSERLKLVKSWGKDLSSLSENIVIFLNDKKDVLERKFREVFLKIINKK